MERFESSPLVYVAQAGAKGRGVFAKQPIAAGTLVERAPVLVLPGDQWKHLNETAAGEYYLDWGDKGSGLDRTAHRTTALEVDAICLDDCTQR